MIQRIQTVYLVGSAISALLVAFMPITEVMGHEKTYIVTAFAVVQDGLNQEMNTMPLLALIGFGFILPVFNIFLYKNRRNQLKVCTLIYVIDVGIMAAAFIISSLTADLTTSPTGALVAYNIAFFLPIAALLFNALAHRSIKKDEKLVKSLDRLR